MKRQESNNSNEYVGVPVTINQIVKHPMNITITQPSNIMTAPPRQIYASASIQPLKVTTPATIQISPEKRQIHISPKIPDQAGKFRQNQSYVLVKNTTGARVTTNSNNNNHHHQIVNIETGSSSSSSLNTSNRASATIVSTKNYASILPASSSACNKICIKKTIPATSIPLVGVATPTIRYQLAKPMTAAFPAQTPAPIELVNVRKRTARKQELSESSTSAIINATNIAPYGNELRRLVLQSTPPNIVNHTAESQAQSPQVTVLSVKQGNMTGLKPPHQRQSTDVLSKTVHSEEKPKQKEGEDQPLKKVKMPKRPRLLDDSLQGEEGHDSRRFFFKTSEEAKNAMASIPTFEVLDIEDSQYLNLQNAKLRLLTHTFEETLGNLTQDMVDFDHIVKDRFAETGLGQGELVSDIKACKGQLFESIDAFYSANEAPSSEFLQRCENFKQSLRRSRRVHNN